MSKILQQNYLVSLQKVLSTIFRFLFFFFFLNPSLFFMLSGVVISYHHHQNSFVVCPFHFQSSEEWHALLGRLSVRRAPESAGTGDCPQGGQVNFKIGFLANINMLWLRCPVSVSPLRIDQTSKLFNVKTSLNKSIVEIKKKLNVSQHSTHLG